VLVDDLITLGTNEPYRMFTSRAEYRLTLREDNADVRLTEIGRGLGLVDEERWQFFCEKQDKTKSELKRLQSTWVQPNTEKGDRINALLEKPMIREYSLADLLARPRVNYHALVEAESGEAQALDQLSPLQEQACLQVEIQLKYQGYIDRQHDEIERLKKQENASLPEGFDYQQMQGLSNELKQKLIAARPENIGRAARIPGMTPAAVSLLLIYLKKHQAVKQKVG